MWFLPKREPLTLVHTKRCAMVWLGLVVFKVEERLLPYSSQSSVSCFLRIWKVLNIVTDTFFFNRDLFFLESQNSLGWRASFKGHLLQPTCNEQGHLQPNQVAQSLSNLTWNASRGLGIHHLSGCCEIHHLFQCFTTLIVKKKYNLIWPFFSVKKLPLSCCNRPSKNLSMAQ